MEVVRQPVVYKFIYASIKKECPRTNFINHKKLLEILKRRLYRLPWSLYLQIINELQFYEFISKHGRTKNLQYELLKETPKDIKKMFPYF